MDKQVSVIEIEGGTVTQGHPAVFVVDWDNIKDDAAEAVATLSDLVGMLPHPEVVEVLEYVVRLIRTEAKGDVEPDSS